MKKGYCVKCGQNMDWSKYDHKCPAPAEAFIPEVVTYYNYFCLKLSCFEAYFGTEKNVIKPCPICGETKDVVARFERKDKC